MGAVRTRVAIPVGAACVAVVAAALPSIASPGNSSGPRRDAGHDAQPAAFTQPDAGRLRDVSVENVADFVAVRVRHGSGYWDGHTDVSISLGGNSYEYRARVGKGDGELELSRKGGRNWKCSDARADAPDASDETLVVIPRACFDTSAKTAKARVTTSVDGGGGSRATSGAVQHTEKPNVVVIMSDDMRDDEMSGPWMDQTRRWIEDSGVRFQNSFAPLPLCAPARASFLTGQYPHNHGVWSHSSPYGFSVFQDDQTLPVWLKRGGYHTFMLGKYINGYTKKSMPAPGGGPSQRYVPPGWSDWRASMDSNGTYNYSQTHLVNNGRIQSLAGRYQTNAYGRIASNKVRERAKGDKPYFMHLSFTAPHHGKPKEKDDPDEVRDVTGDKYRIKTPARPKKVRGRWDDDIPVAPGAGGESDMSDKPEFMQMLPGLTADEKEGVRDLARQRAESLKLLDKAVARVMRTLKAQNELDNTYVMFTSDNGYFLGEHRMRQGKTLPYEPSLRTPTTVRGPGIPAGQTRHDPFLSIDFAPTILQMGGLSTDRQPAIDGQSMLDVAQQGDKGWSRPVLTESGPATVPTLMDLDGNTFGDDPNEESKRSRVRGIRTPEYLYTETSGREPELYDLLRDPGEVTNIVNDARTGASRDELKQVLDDMQSCIGKECRATLPEHLQSESAQRDGGDEKSGGKSDESKQKDSDKPKSDKADGKGNADKKSKNSSD